MDMAAGINIDQRPVALAGQYFDINRKFLTLDNE